MAKRHDVPEDDDEAQNTPAGQILRPMMPLAEQRERDLKLLEEIEAERAAEDARRTNP